MTEVSTDFKGDILAIDDTPANLQLLVGMLKEWGYKGRAAPNGRLGLQAVKKNAPDLILLDINMPEIDGYQVCEQLKADPVLRDIPVIFISALSETMDKVKAFGVGGVDYITKPFQFEEVKVRIETHIKLRKLQIAEQELREKTLNGAVKVMLDMLSLTIPAASARAKHIQRLALHIAAQTGLRNTWELKLAGRLSQIGALALSENTLKKALAGAALSDKEKQMWAGVPKIGQRLLANIPRLEAVASLVGLHAGQGNPTSPDFEQQRSILYAATVAAELGEHMSWPEVLKQLQGRDNIDESIIKALHTYDSQGALFESRSVNVSELMPAMIVEQDITTASGQILLSGGQELNPLLIERLQNFARNDDSMQGPFKVRAPVKQA